ncbi:MAG: metallophosphoesterase [Actinomycetota bacterium]|nr:metallophosphoesterase [Actinomycetota bacterium]
MRMKGSVPGSQHSARGIVLIVLLAAACTSASAQTTPAPGSASPASGTSSDDPVIAAVGDIACKSLPSEHNRRCRYNEVAKGIREMKPDRFLALGDLQYLHGSYSDFLTYYDRYFGDLKSITEPVPGNHETYTLGMKGYFRYFGTIARPHGGWSYPNKGGYYSWNLGGWHFIALNSQACKGSTWNPALGRGAPISSNPIHTNGCGPGSSMYAWLQQDLALHPNDQYPCTIAYFHHPLFAWWPYRETVAMLGIQPLYQALDEAGVDVVLNGHFHNYQRWRAQDAFGHPDPNGISEFIVGTGGDTFENDFPTDKQQPANLEAYQAHSFGVLKMTLHDGSYDYEFVPAPGQRPYEDAGHASCN